MSFDFSTLITDRTSSDLQSLRDLLGKPMSEWTEAEKAEFNLARSKGAYNYTDLNRVTEAMEYINERFESYGYSTGYADVWIESGRKVWEAADIPTAVQMTAYLDNVDALRSTLEVMATTPQPPESMEALTWVEANNIEQILLDIDTLVTSMSKVFLRSGVAWVNSGGPNFYFEN